MKPYSRSARARRARLVPGVAALGVLGYHLVDPLPPTAGWAALAVVAAYLAEQRHPRPTGGRPTDHADARTDQLTGLANRRGFLEELDRRLDGDGPLAVLLTDLDGFKEVNDSLGHQAGDELLRAVARRFTEPLGPGAVMGRLGGDEFGILLPVDDAVAALRWADLLHETLLNPFEIEGVTVNIGASTGVAVRAGLRTRASDLLRQADVAMYDAKRRETDALLYDPESDPHGRERLLFVEELRTALDAEALTVHLQPIVDVPSGRIVAAEALVRWPHARLGLIYPEAFVPLAEKLGLMPQLTRHVLDLAIAAVAELPDIVVHVNISTRDLADQALPDDLAARLGHAGFAPDRLVLELTEASLGLDHLRAVRQIEAFRAIGVGVAIDDFGVGKSSATELATLPVRALKLDGSLHRAAEGDARALAVVRSALALAAALELDVIAEGIESPAAHDLLGTLGVTMAQGYHYAPPLPPKGFAGYLAAIDRREGVNRRG